MNNPRYSVRRPMDSHREKVQVLCRVCGRVLVVRGKRHNASYQCTVFSEHLNSVFGIAITIHPLLFCYRCKRVIDKSVHAQHNLASYKTSTIVLKWEAHDEEKECLVSLSCTCMYMDIIIAICRPKRGARRNI